MSSDRLSPDSEPVPGSIVLQVSVSEGRKRLCMRPSGSRELGTQTGVSWMESPLLRPIHRAISDPAAESTEERGLPDHLDRAASCDVVAPRCSGHGGACRKAARLPRQRRLTSRVSRRERKRRRIDAIAPASWGRAIAKDMAEVGPTLRALHRPAPEPPIGIPRDDRVGPCNQPTEAGPAGSGVVLVSR